jgi:hypothetical protein
MNPLEWMEPEEDFLPCKISTAIEFSQIPLGRRFFNKHYSAGLSPDCNSVFFLSEKNIVVYSLDNFPKVLEADVRLNKAPLASDDYKAAKATLTNRFLAIIMRGKSRQLSVFEHSASMDNGRDLGSDLFHMWYPDCLTMHEASDRTWVAIGGRSSQAGSIKMYRIEDVHGKLSLKRHDAQFEKCVPNALSNDWLKVIDFSPDGRRLVCLTNNKNKVLVWFLSNNARPRQAAFEIERPYEGVSPCVS